MKLPEHKPQNFWQLFFTKEELQSGRADSHHDSLFTQLELGHNPQYFWQSRFTANELQSGYAASQYDSLFSQFEDAMSGNKNLEVIHNMMLILVI